MHQPFRDLQTIPRTARRARVPVPLLLSRHHSALAVAAYGLLDTMGSQTRPVVAGRVWLAERLGVSPDGLAKALGALSRAHVGADALTPDAPVWLISQHRGDGLTALRATVPGVPYVDVPVWTLGDGSGPLVGQRAWRMYALLLHLRRPEHGTVALGRRELAAIGRCRPETVVTLCRELEVAGLLFTAARAGRESLLLPVCVPLDDAGRVAAQKRLDQYAQPVDKQVATGAPTPSTGTAPHPCAGTAPTPSMGTTRRDPLYVDPNYGDPAPARAFAPTALAPADDGHGVLATPSPPARSLSLTASWCGRCPGPSRRIETDPETGRPTGRACPRCGPRETRRVA